MLVTEAIATLTWVEQPSAKGLFFNADLYISGFLPHHRQLQPEGIKDWRLRTDSWLLCSTVGFVPHLRHLFVAELCIGNFQIRYRLVLQGYFLVI